jgi:spiro-SPASM protein
MKTAALIYSGSLTQRALEPLAGGPSAYQRCLDFVGRLPGLDRALVLEGQTSLPEGPWPKERRDAWVLDSVLERLSRLGEEVDAVFFLWGDQPFLDTGLALRMLENFRRYRAQYAFADGYPVGLSTEILSPRIVPALRSLGAGPEAAGSSPPARDSIFTVIQKDINAFDIETEISPLDLRDLRLTLACDSKRETLLVERLIAAGAADEKSLLELIPRRLDLLRSLPAFVQVQVSGACPQSCELCPYPKFGGDILTRGDFMPRERFASLLDQVVELSDDAVIDLSLWGEPSLHPDIGGLVEEVLERPSLSLIVETSGIAWDRAVPERLARLDGSERIHWVVSLDAWSPELYARLRGPGYAEYAEASAFAEFLIALFPKTAYTQIVRARENEAELEAFWRGWKKKTENVIVQKYSTCAGLLPQRSVADLSPLARRPCWHLKRDLSILIDGTVTLCRECARKEIVLGNAFEPSGVFGPGLAAAWAAGEAQHILHVRGDYPAPCAGCDEYYTYNA